jgi:hypothetical protein
MLNRGQGLEMAENWSLALKHTKSTRVGVSGAWRANSTLLSTQYVVSCCVVPVLSPRVMKKVLICLHPIAVNLCISARIMTHFGLRINCQPKSKVYF